MSSLLTRSNVQSEQVVDDALLRRDPFAFVGKRAGWRFIWSKGAELPSALVGRTPRRERSVKTGEIKIRATSIGRNLDGAPGEVRLGDAVYHLETERLFTANGEEQILRSQSAIVLKYLAENLGALVTRDSLIEKVWPDIAVTDDSLTQCISDIRKVLNDHGRSILKTVPKRGFILRGELVAPVDASDFAEIDVQFRHRNDVVLAVRGLFETAHALVNRLPDGMLPKTTRSHDAGIAILVYADPKQALQAALHIVSTMNVAVAVDYSDNEGNEAETLLQIAEPGRVLTSPDISTTMAAAGDFDFHDLGEVSAPTGQDKLRPFRVTRHDAQHTIISQLDARDVLPTLAILPFRAQNEGPENVVGIFLADEIATAVSRSEEVNVISRLSSGSFGRQGGSLLDVKRVLKADFALSGSYYQSAGKVMVSIEFAETETQFVLWSDRIQLAIDPLLRETDGVGQIVAHIRKAINLNEVRRVRSQPLDSLKLFSVLHGAVGLMHRLSFKEFHLAHEYLKYVIGKAPNHPAPLAWMARWHVLRTVQGWADDPNQEAFEALELTARALDIDPDHTLALVCEGQVLANLAHRLDEAQDRYDAALLTNPNDAQARSLRGMLTSFRDQGVDGKRDAERALHLSPLDPHRFMFLALAAGANISAEDYPRAVALAKESLRLNRTHISTLRTLAVAQEGAGQHEDALKTAASLLRLQPDLRVSQWLKNSPGSQYKMAQSAAEKLRNVGIPD